MAIVNRKVSTLITSASGGNALVAKNAPNRIYLGLFATGGTATVYVSVSPMTAISQGLFLASQGGRLGGMELLSKDTPQLCQCEWYAFVSIGGSNPVLVVLEEYSEDTDPHLPPPPQGILTGINGNGAVLNARARRLKAAIESAWARVRNARG